MHLRAGDSDSSERGSGGVRSPSTERGAAIPGHAARASRCSECPLRREDLDWSPPELHCGPVSGIGHDRRLGKSLGRQRVDLLEGDLPLGLESDLGGIAGDPPSSTIDGPLLRQVETVGGQSADRFVDEAERHPQLAVVLLAEVSAIQTRNADGVGLLFRDPGVSERPHHHSAVTIHLVEHDTVGDAEEGPALSYVEVRRRALGPPVGRGEPEGEPLLPRGRVS